MTDLRLVRPSWRGRTNVDALTIAALARAEDWAGHEFVVTQGSYQPSGGGDPKSAGTHDGGGVVDLRWCGHIGCIGYLRRAGFAAWLRVPPSFTYHIHAVVVGHPLLDPQAADQVAELRRGGDGLVGSAPDNGPKMPVVEPIFPWPPPEKPKVTPPRFVNAVKRLRRLKANKWNTPADKAAIKAAIKAVQSVEKR